MREIKFRAWDNDFENMIFLSGGIPSQALIASHNNKSGIILMQYTGLKDKSGKEIYTGDILKLTHEYDLTEDKFHLHDLIDDTCYLRMFDVENIEIIGNIYENPELIS